MQILVIFFLAAIVGCFGDESECEKNAKECVEGFLQATVSGSSNFRRCREIANSIGCLEEKIDTCAGHEKEDDVKEGLEDLRKAKHESCLVLNPLSEDDDEIQKCFEENEADIMLCFMEGTDDVMNAINNLNDADNVEDRIKCGLFISIGQCALDKLEEKCGVDATEEAKEQLAAVPAEIYNACEKSGILLSDAFGLDEKKK